MKKSLFLSLLIFLSLMATAQQAPDTLRKDALNVYMEASDYVRKEIPYLNYVRDIRDAGVYIISTYQRTGSGGVEYSYFLVGQHQYEGMRDTLTVLTSPDDTQDAVRSKQVRALKMGLMRYVAKTPLAQYMDISFTQPISENVSTDIWNQWVFSLSFNGWLDAQQSNSSTNVYGNISATKVNEKWKINLAARYSYGKDIFEITDSTTTTEYTSENNSKSISGLAVRSISDHWSVGGSASIGYSSYSNERLSFRFMPGLEYDLFPYSESTRRQLRILYSFGYEGTHYIDTTIYNKLREGHLLHALNLAYEVVQKWGSIELDLNYRNYLYNWTRNNLSISGYVNLRVLKGLNVTVGGGAGLIHDQLNLEKGGATPEEILLRRKELATNFQYFTSFGFTYTFGSIYNNVVNPRFGSIGGGGMTIIMN